MVISALNRKLLRDLSRMKGQVLTIALVVACGVAAFVTFFGAYRSLRTSERGYYERTRFADVFASCTRAPRELEPLLSQTPGVSVVETRVVVDVSLDMPDLDEPVRGRLISIPDGSPPLLNLLALREGRTLDPQRPDEAIVTEPFARAHRLHAGDAVRAVVNGRVRTFRIAGLALSPEYVFALPPGSAAHDDARYGVMWVSRDALSSMYDMQGAFNDVTLRLAPGASQGAVIARVDALLAPYGGIGAYGRDEQSSAHFLKGEFDELETYATVLPAIFVGVAAFLLHVVLTRLIGTQRDQIATLKAFGYSDLAVGGHYLSLVAVIVALGSLLGTGIGWFFGIGITARYEQFFRFPDLRFRLEPGVVLLGTGVTLLASSIGALGAARAAVRLAPAEAMRPEAPARFRRSLVERLGLSFLLSGEARMIVRSLGRRPFRSALAAVGIAFGTAIVAVTFFMFDSFDRLIDYQFGVVSREDTVVVFRQQVDLSAETELRKLDGVFEVEGFRAVPVRLRSQNHTKKVPITGLPPHPHLRRIVATDGTVIEPPAEGVVLSKWLAEYLDVKVGGVVTVEVLDGARVVREAKVAGVLEEMIGLNAYMRLDALHRLLGEEEKLSGVRMLIDPRQQTAIEASLKGDPEVASVMSHATILQIFNSQTGAWMTLMTTILSAFGAVIAFGVVYNTARISLAERERELASLRVLGFTVGEITTIFVGELVVLVAFGIPLGCFLLSKLFAWFIVSSGNLESYRFPLDLEPSSLAIAVLVTSGSALASALIVRRKLDRLDLVGVLKTRD